MPVRPGTRFDPYEILGLIGAGGMSEVSKPHDTRLDRRVAIKALPIELSADSEWRPFEREGKMLSALSHPHICTLYDVGERDGACAILRHAGSSLRADHIRRGASSTVEVDGWAFGECDAQDGNSGCPETLR